MSTLDHDKDGRISYDEFREGFEVRHHYLFLLSNETVIIVGVSSRLSAANDIVGGVGF